MLRTNWFRNVLLVRMAQFLNSVWWSPLDIIIGSWYEIKSLLSIFLIMNDLFRYLVWNSKIPLFDCLMLRNFNLKSLSQVTAGKYQNQMRETVFSSCNSFFCTSFSWRCFDIIRFELSASFRHFSARRIGHRTVFDNASLLIGNDPTKRTNRRSTISGTKECSAW